jgi:hypothetical protein
MDESFFETESYKKALVQAQAAVEYRCGNPEALHRMSPRGQFEASQAERAEVAERLLREAFGDAAIERLFAVLDRIPNSPAPQTRPSE